MNPAYSHGHLQLRSFLIKERFNLVEVAETIVVTNVWSWANIIPARSHLLHQHVKINACYMQQLPHRGINIFIMFIKFIIKNNFQYDTALDQVLETAF